MLMVNGTTSLRRNGHRKMGQHSGLIRAATVLPPLVVFPLIWWMLRMTSYKWARLRMRINRRNRKKESSRLGGLWIWRQRKRHKEKVEEAEVRGTWKWTRTAQVLAIFLHLFARQSQTTQFKHSSISLSLCPAASIPHPARTTCEILSFFFPPFFPSHYHRWQITWSWTLLWNLSSG